MDVVKGSLHGALWLPAMGHTDGGLHDAGKAAGVLVTLARCPP